VTTPDDWFDGSAVPSASFNGPPPITWSGQITDEPVLIQKRDYDDGTPLTWPDGRPKQLLQVNIQTDQRDPNNPDDDGKRALYLEFRKKDAVQEAIKRSGNKGAPKKGGWLSLSYVGDDHAAKVGKKQAPKIYQAEYRAPDPWANVDGAQAPQAAPQQGGWGQMPPPPPQGYQAPPAAPQGYPPQGPPPQQQPAPTSAPQGAPAGNPVADFLRTKNIDAASMDPNMALSIAQQLGYQG
jgi:hypothetical protein